MPRSVPPTEPQREQRACSRQDPYDITLDPLAGVTFTFDPDSVLDEPGEYAHTHRHDRAGRLRAILDAAGVTTQTQLWDLRDLRGRLAGHDGNGDGDYTDEGDVTYAHAADGLTVLRRHGATVTRLLQDRQNPTGYSQVLEERLADGAVARAFVVGLDVISQLTPDGDPNVITPPSRLLYDAGGHTRAVLDGMGRPIDGQIFSYDSHGNPTHGVEVADGLTVHRYRGERVDLVSERYDLRSRLYDTVFGFTQRDSYEPGVGDFLNAPLYLYAGGDPISGWDPTGQLTLTQTLLTSSGIGALSGLIIGGIQGGVEGALVGAVSGAIMAPVVTMGAVGLGIGLAAATGISTTAGLATSFGLTMGGSMAWNIYGLMTAENDRERWAAGVGIIFTLAGGAYGGIKFAKLPSLPSNAAASKLGIFPNNKSNAGTFMSEYAAALRLERVVAREVTITAANGVKMRVDLVVRTITGKLRFIELKWGSRAQATANQKAAIPSIVKDGGTVRGNNGSTAGLNHGDKVGPTEVQFDTWNGASVGGF
jgi:RHS repeat-associated protein